MVEIIGFLAKEANLTIEALTPEALGINDNQLASCALVDA